MNRSNCALGYIISYFSGEPDPHESRQVTASFPRHRRIIFPTPTSLLHKYTVTQCRPLIYYHMPLCKCVCVYVHTPTSTQRWNPQHIHIKTPLILVLPNTSSQRMLRIFISRKRLMSLIEGLNSSTSSILNLIRLIYFPFCFCIEFQFNDTQGYGLE
jgi:hypothetical protein